MKKVSTDHINFNVKQSAPEDYIRTMLDLMVLAFGNGYHTYDHVYGRGAKMA